MTTGGLLAGAGVGLGLVLVARGLLAGPPPLRAALAALEPADEEARSAASTSLRLRVAQAVSGGLSALGVDLRRFDADLRVIGRSHEQHLIRKLAAGLVGLGLPPILGLLAWGAGVGVPASLVFVASLGLTVGAFLLPDALLRGEAAERRRSFRFALSSYLDLVHIVLAAGAGVDTALRDAAEAGQGWAFDRLRGTILRSHVTGESPWEAFGRLGDELDISELRELASSLRLAGTHGARVRSTLETRAQSMRARDLAEMEGEAESATERMSIPSVVLVVGFIAFVGYPALHVILGF